MSKAIYSSISLSSSTFLFRVVGQLKLIIPSEEYWTKLSDEITKFTKSLHLCAFKVVKLDLMLKDGILCQTNNIRLQDPLNNIIAKECLVSEHEDRYSLSKKALKVELYLCSNALARSNEALKMEICKDAETLEIPLDVLITCNEDTEVSALCVKFSNAIVEQMILSKRFIQDYEAEPEIFHFYHKACVLSVLFPKNGSDLVLAEIRKDLHSSLSLRSKKPIFKETMSLFHNIPDENLLLTVQKHVQDPTTNQSVSTAKVSGNYIYYHYRVDGVDDKGWGCAYRSLQTVCSWFLLNGYTSKQVPALVDIQKILVEIGDKTDSFVNSKNWIGCMEASYVLEHYLNVSSRILHLKSPSEMKENASVLYSHFKSSRCPVIIGGGVLAHTILGVCYDEDTNFSKFFVLDPHYDDEGNDLKTIVSKGYCGWKDYTFWSSKTYYNLCLPIVTNQF